MVSSFAAAFMLLTTIGTVALLPLMAPVLVQGVEVSGWSLAKPLLTMVLLASQPLSQSRGIFLEFLSDEDYWKYWLF